MAQEISDRRDMDFVLYEQLEVEKLIKHEKFSGFNRKTLDLLLSEARNLAIKELLPINAAGTGKDADLKTASLKYRNPFTGHSNCTGKANGSR